MRLPVGVKPKYGIFTADREFANYTIQNYIAKQNKNVIERVYTTNACYAIMDDGTEYEWIKPNNYARGYKCSAGYIDLATCSLDFIKEWILPICLFADKEDFVFGDSENTAYCDIFDLHTLIDHLQKIEAVLGNIENIVYSDSEYGLEKVRYLDADKDRIKFDTYC